MKSTTIKKITDKSQNIIWELSLVKARGVKEFWVNSNIHGNDSIEFVLEGISNITVAVREFNKIIKEEEGAL